MKLLKNKTFKGFVMGILFALAVSVCVGGVYAKSQNKSIMVLIGGIKIYLDEQLQILKDGNGKVVEPMIYNGTTYLPVRGVAQLVGKEVHWDQKTMSVSLGKKVTKGQIDLATLKDYYNNSSNYVQTGQNATFRKLDKTTSAFNLINSWADLYYVLDSNYTAIKGKFDIPYTQIGASTTSTLKFYSVDVFGTETEIGSYSSRAGAEPVDVNVNLQGVKILKISVGRYGAFYNATLQGLK